MSGIIALSSIGLCFMALLIYCFKKEKPREKTWKMILYSFLLTLGLPFYWILGAFVMFFGWPFGQRKQNNFVDYPK